MSLQAVRCVANTCAENPETCNLFLHNDGVQRILQKAKVGCITGVFCWFVLVLEFSRDFSSNVIPACLLLLFICIWWYSKIRFSSAGHGTKWTPVFQMNTKWWYSLISSIINVQKIPMGEFGSEQNYLYFCPPKFHKVSLCITPFCLGKLLSNKMTYLNCRR